jgi:hypothetical protein
MISSVRPTTSGSIASKTRPPQVRGAPPDGSGAEDAPLGTCGSMRASILIPWALARLAKSIRT